MKNIKHEFAPSSELVKEYENLLNHYLSPHRVDIKIQIYREPLDIECFCENMYERHSWIERHWIEDVIVNSPEVENLFVTLFSDGIEGGEKIKGRAWCDAHHIQDMIYKELKRLPSSPPRDGDPYWELWKKHPTHPS